jgi:hypothetical protein
MKVSTDVLSRQTENRKVKWKNAQVGAFKAGFLAQTESPVREQRYQVSPTSAFAVVVRAAPVLPVPSPISATAAR